MEDVPLIYDDPREIRSIWYPGENEEGWSITRPSISKIVAYREHGVLDFMPYFAVYDSDGAITARVPAYMVSVSYVTPLSPQKR